MPGGDFVRTAVAARQNRVLVGSAATPDRADRVDDAPGGKLVALGDLGVARLAAVQRPAFGEKRGAGGGVDRAVDAPAAQQGRIGGVETMAPGFKWSSQ